MELTVATTQAGPRAVATTQAGPRNALTVAAWRLLLLIALAYGISFLVPACISFMSGQVHDQEPRAAAVVQGSGLNLHAELVCGSAPPRLWERSACNLPK